MKRTVVAIAAVLVASVARADCPALLDHDMRVLRKPDSANLCERYAGKPLLVVNTASHCGYTAQFQGLEALYDAYRERGLRVAGFPSDDFHQEADDEQETAQVCFVNYGVSFDMYAPVHVKGDKAHPLFAELARQSKPPRWNFTKYLVDRQGRVVATFGPGTRPDDPELLEAIGKVL